MIRGATATRFVLTALGLGVGMVAGYFLGPAFSAGDGLDALGAAVIGALVGAPIGAVGGNFLDATMPRHRGSGIVRGRAGRAVLEGFGLVLGLFGGYALVSMSAEGQDVHVLRAVVAIVGAVLGFAAGAYLADRIPAQRNGDGKGNGES